MKGDGGGLALSPDGWVGQWCDLTSFLHAAVGYIESVDKGLSARSGRGGSHPSVL